MIAEQTKDKEKISEVVSKAVIRAADDLGLNGCQLARTIGLSEATVSRIRAGTCAIKYKTKAFEMAMLVIRIQRALAQILADDQKAIQTWMASENKELNAAPVKKIGEVCGLVSVLSYVEFRAMNA